MLRALVKTCSVLMKEEASGKLHAVASGSFPILDHILIILINKHIWRVVVPKAPLRGNPNTPLALALYKEQVIHRALQRCLNHMKHLLYNFALLSTFGFSAALV